MKRFIALCRRFNQATMAISAGLMALTVFLCSMQVFTRTALSFSFRWTEEVTRYVVIFMVFLASGTLLAEDAHPRVEILCQALPRKAQLWLNCLYYFLIFWFAVALTYYGWQLAASSTRTYCSSIRIPWAVPFSAVCLGGVNMVLQVPAKFLANLLEIRALSNTDRENAHE